MRQIGGTGHHVKNIGEVFFRVFTFETIFNPNQTHINVYHLHRNKLNFYSNVALKPISSLVRCGVQSALSLSRNDSTLSTNSRDSRKDKKNVQASR